MMSQDESCQSEKTSWRFLTKLEKMPSQGQKYHVIFPSKIEMLFLDAVSGTQGQTFVDIDQAPIEFSFYLSGCFEGNLQYSLQRREEIVWTSGLSQLSFLPQTRCRFTLEENQHYRVLNIYIPPEIFWKQFKSQLDCLPRKLARILESGKQHPYNEMIPMSCQLRTLVEELFQCPYQGVLQQLYLEAKTMEIVVRHLWELARLPVQAPCLSLGHSERAQIHEARAILLRDLANPPSLDMLARAVGVNPNKLNQGFRQEFGMTVFAWYRKTRIQHACELLRQGQLNIDETAQALGFHDTPHFIRHFKQHFGKTPGMYLKEQHICLPFS